MIKGDTGSLDYSSYPYSRTEAWTSRCSYYAKQRQQSLILALAGFSMAFGTVNSWRLPTAYPGSNVENQMIANFTVVDALYTHGTAYLKQISKMIPVIYSGPYII